MKRILVIGDIIADVYRDCVFKKMCPDASGVRAIVERSREVRPGGAANVAVNLAALTSDVQIDLIGVLDSSMGRLVKLMSSSRVDMAHCVFDSPLRKERVTLGDEFIVRVDDPDFHDLQADSVLESLRHYLAAHDPELIVLSDYGSGSVALASLSLLLEHREKLLVDTKLQDLSVFASGGRRTLLIKLNGSEWRAASALNHSPEQHFNFMVVTHGSDGAELVLHTIADSPALGCERPGRTIRQSLFARGHVVPTADVCGCGDTFLAGLTAALFEGRDPYTAVQFANAAAATVVSQPRTAVASLGKMLELLGRN